MSSSILVVAPESAAIPVADALRLEMRTEVETALTLRAALNSIRHNDFAVILLDESLPAADLDNLYQNAGAALIVELNFAVSSAARIVRQARAALIRRTKNQAQARAAAAGALHSELNASLAGLLLESELALRDASPAQALRLRHLVELAVDLRDRLRA